MRKFKLVREYPQSPPKDTIVTKDIHGQYVAENPLLIFQRIDIELYPEFWEEVKEKFPKIISFRRISDKTLYTLGRYDLYWGKEVIGGYTLDVMITQGKNTNYVEIYQVAVSETEVFTLGDKVIDGNNPNQGSFTILGFEYEPSPNDKEKHTGVITLLHDHKVLGKWLDLTKLEKAPEVLFVTEDGVYVFEGDIVHWVNSNTCDYLYSTKFSEFHPAILKGETIFKIFSTKEAAEQYIDENKPIYSKKQIKEVFDGCYTIEKYRYCDFRGRDSIDVAIFKEKIFKQKLGL